MTGRLNAIWTPAEEKWRSVRPAPSSGCINEPGARLDHCFFNATI